MLQRFHTQPCLTEQKNARNFKLNYYDGSNINLAKLMGLTIKFSQRRNSTSFMTLCALSVQMPVSSLMPPQPWTFQRMFPLRK